MLDSPYVRRVAISLQLLRVPFDHASISVFRTFAQFQQINPVVKAPTLVCDDGTVLMDSTLIIEYAEALAGQRKSLMPSDIAERQHALRIIGLALAACEKSVQIIYERQLRPAEKLHEPWVTRVTGQLLAAYAALDLEIAAKPLAVTSGAINQAGISAAVAWHFTQQTLPEVVVAKHYPALAALSSNAELLAEFLAAPHGDGIYRRVDDRRTRTASESGRNQCEKPATFDVRVAAVGVACARGLLGRRRRFEEDAKAGRNSLWQGCVCRRRRVSERRNQGSHRRK